MKKIKVYLVTYKRSDILNDSLDKLFKSDFNNFCNTEVIIINNHSEFSLDDHFVKRVSVLHNQTRPDWSNGNLGENWNQALLHGFKDLTYPEAECVVTMQNDTSVHPNWCSNMIKMQGKYNFIVGQYGDNLVSYTPEAVKSIGMWDENFTGVQYKEADYWIRALIFNKDKSMINDTLHGLTLNNHDALILDTDIDRNFVEVEDVVKRKADDAEHKDIWLTRGGIYKTNAWKYFVHKWSGTWKSEPEKEGWVKNWSKDLIDSPPDFSKSNVKNYMKYIYFEKDISNKKSKNYVF
jgi:hypothetical protein